MCAIADPHHHLFKGHKPSLAPVPATRTVLALPALPMETETPPKPRSPLTSCAVPVLADGDAKVQKLWTKLGRYSEKHCPDF